MLVLAFIPFGCVIVDSIARTLVVVIRLVRFHQTPKLLARPASLYVKVYRQFLLDVRNHKFEYDEILELLEADKEKMTVLMEKSSIREKVDTGFVNELMIDIRKKQFGI